MRHHAYLGTLFEEKGIVGTCPVTLQGESLRGSSFLKLNGERTHFSCETTVCI